MGTSISTRIMAFNGQCVNQIYHDEEQQCTIIKCSRDKRRNVIDPITGSKGTINQYIKRHVRDLPLFGKPCFVEIELAQVFTAKNSRRIKNCSFVEKGNRFTHRFCHMISGLCRHMSIQAVSKHLNLRWETVKNIDKIWLFSALLSEKKYLYP